MRSVIVAVLITLSAPIAWSQTEESPTEELELIEFVPVAPLAPKARSAPIISEGKNAARIEYFGSPTSAIKLLTLATSLAAANKQNTVTAEDLYAMGADMAILTEADLRELIARTDNRDGGYDMFISSRNKVTKEYIYPPART